MVTSLLLDTAHIFFIQNVDEIETAQSAQQHAMYLAPLHVPQKPNLKEIHIS